MSIKDLIAQLALRRSARHMASEQLAFPGSLKHPKHILVCLPGGLRELTLVKQFLPVISDMFKPADIALLSAPGVRVNDIFPRKGFQILSPTSDQLTWSGLPKKSYIKVLKDMKIDVVLDLNLQQSNFTSSILLNFPEAVRIGRGNHLGRPYYNLEIKTKYLRDERNIYKSLLETIQLVRRSN
ncbi:MAG: hypothetical protein JSU65_06980 [Candidatus Zixiibacteriota bacterium]|nr:MAG: hypothetical protein JSU65_06980 [candidate division Zixibacteria bacterium]